MPLVITPPLPPYKPSSDINWQEFHWFQVSLSDHEALVVDTMKSSMNINKTKDTLMASCSKTEADHKENALRIKNSINQF